jgi:exopolysaccharide biosynthesis polyprenyl glycosylphosphotransferase
MSQRRRAVLTLVSLADLVVVTGSLVLSIALTVDPFGGHGWREVLEMRLTILNALFVGAYLIAWHLILKARGLYGSDRLASVSKELREVAMAVTIATVPLIPLSLLFRFTYVTLYFLVCFPTCAFLLLSAERVLLRAIAHRLRNRGRNLRHVVIIGSARAARDAALLAGQDGLGYEVVEEIPVGLAAYANAVVDDDDPVLKRLATLFEEQPVDEVFVGLPLDGSQPLTRSVISRCEEEGVIVRLIPHLALQNSSSASLEVIGGQPVITISSGPPESIRLVAKRLIDLAGAAIGIIVCAPLFVAIAIAIKLDSKGPVFFVQERVGRNRHRFRTFKFRTMVEDAPEMQKALESLNEARGPVFKIKDDPRVTRVGKWLRRLSLDELPQLFNVLVGNMSLVGPRPLPRRDVDRIDIRWHKRRFSVTPGITCLWQVNDRTPNFDDWVRSDMDYIDNWSLALDLKILAKTLPAVISRQGVH